MSSNKEMKESEAATVSLGLQIIFGLVSKIECIPVIVVIKVKYYIERLHTKESQDNIALGKTTNIYKKK